MTFKRLIGKLHLWLGLITGIVVIIVSLTGCIYVFSQELSSWAYKDRQVIEVPETPERLSLLELKTAAQAVVPDSIPLARLFIPSSPDKTVSFVFSKTKEHVWTYNEHIQYNKTVYVNPYTAEVVFIENTKWEFFNLMYWLHITLLMPYEIGSPIVTYSVYIFVFLLFSGIILWWPKKNSNLKKYFGFFWKKSTNWKRKNYDLHQILGLYVTPIALILALTGLYYSSPNLRTLTLWVANGGKTIPEAGLAPLDQPVVHSDDPLDVIYNVVDSIAVDELSIMIRPPFRPNFPYAARAYMAEQNYKRMEFYFDQNSLRLQDTITFESRNSGGKYGVMNYDLHVGTIGGMPTKILAFLASLICASLPITGFYVWWLRKNKWKKLMSLS